MEKSKRLISVGIATARRLCTAAIESESRRPEPRKSGSLYRRLSILGATGENVSSAVNKFLREGNFPKKYELESCVRELRRYKKHQNALELIEWMEKRGINLSYSDFAVKLDLLAKTQGIDSAEKYFNSLSSRAKNRMTYGALLNCYSKEKMAGKAMVLFLKMDELNYVDSALAYNNIMTLYMRLNEPEKVPPLVQEMKERNISLDTFTYNVLMNSYACLKDIDGVERVMEEVETKDSDKCDWTIYSNLAAIYIDAHLFDKAELALKQLEEKILPRDRRAYHFLISLYARTKNLSEVHRVWSSLKLAFPKTNNLSYLVVLQALGKLDDLDGIKECFEEWLSGYTSYDIRLTNALVGVYLKWDMIKEAKLLIEDAVKRGYGPNYRTHEIFMDYFLKTCQTDLALKCMETAVSKVKENEWKPSQERIRAFLEYFEEEKDVNGAEAFCQMLKKVNCLDAEAYKLLLCTYVAAGRTEPEIRRRMKADGIEISSEVEDLLARVCPE
ncbi:Pentatricopeptide repeat [Macleaya cordata]|uniref:Pentatricopeptide repeat n=1 Tax=Macleaya cordata TaxID=56857 RepID=A0A200PWD1_MACCD|nr:Pentatricopeptide repeat [Macleaya cordata]